MDLSFIGEFTEKNNITLFSYAVQTEDGIFEYVSGKGNPLNDSYSVTKAFAATAVGMLFDEGKIDFDEKALDILEKENIRPADKNWEKVTVRHALRHTMGIGQGYLDVDVEDIHTYGTDDFLKVLFDRSLVYEPGTREVYSDAAYYLVSRIVEARAGERLDEYLMRKLLYPMKVREAAFSRCPRNHTIGATGLFIRSSDMVELGYLYANDGVWEGKRLLSSEWVKKEKENGFAFRPAGQEGIFGKGGMCGQMLLYSPEKKYAAAWHSYTPDGKAATLTQLTKEFMG